MYFTKSSVLEHTYHCTFCSFCHTFFHAVTVQIYLIKVRGDVINYFLRHAQLSQFVLLLLACNTGEAILFSLTWPFSLTKKMKYRGGLHKLTQRFLCILCLCIIRKGTGGARNKILDVCIAAEIIIFMYFTTLTASACPFSVSLAPPEDLCASSSKTRGAFPKSTPDFYAFLPGILYTLIFYFQL